MQDKAVFGALVRATFAEDPQVRSPAECIVTRARSAVDQWEAIERLKRPLLVKSAWAGSSEHLHLFDEADEAVAVADALTAAEGKVLVQSLERAQKEVSCTVLDSPTGPIFLPVVELMRGSAAVMGKDEKFGDDARSRHLVSPTLAQELQEKLREVVFRLHEAVGATGLTRTDILILPNDELVVLEMNGIPGLLDSSIACDAAAAAGISFPQLCEAYADSAFIPRAEPDVWLGKIRRSRPPQL
jgi:D-alanine-D-alanine ligase-like ATP-grasp enzyme